ncbi:moulting cycle domain-containing protein [Ditylenchus destructor]|uniref:Moulting cycle domain-containing protein n=1 Tax=Ditylenchus destructor TaxID=166010 RepID=A0AAD4NBH4_9BILA|nr:moulting cycle domain-containing protein [Ditylenchus destructor]
MLDTVSCAFSLQKFDVEGILGASEAGSEIYAFNPGMIDSFFRRAAIMTLLKAKAKSLFSDLPPVERIVYNNCAESANSAVALAKCLLKLMKVRDYATENKVLSSSRPLFMPDSKEMSPDIHGSNPREDISVFGQWKRVIIDIANSFIQFASWPKQTSADPTAGNDRRPNERIVVDRSLNEDHHRPSNTLCSSAVMPSNTYTGTNYSLLRRKLLLKSHREKDANFARIKKSIPEAKILRNIENMKKLHQYISMANRYNSYVKRTTEHNVKFLKSLPSFSGSMFDIRDKSVTFARSLTENLEQIFRQSQLQKFSILSPRVFSIFPSHSNDQAGDDAKVRILSPELFSFYNNSGFLSLPQLFGLASMDERESLEWIDLIVAMSGAGRSIQKLLEKHRDEINLLKHNLYPAVLKMERRDRKWERTRRSLTPAQRMSLREQNYVFLNTGQQRLVYGNTNNAISYGNEIDKEKRLEREIKSLANLEFGEGGMPTRIGGESPDTEDGRIPQAHVLSPRAFIAAILSPLALGAKILSPAAFRAEILSPEALSAYVLTPEAFITEILSPCVLETRVASPKAMVLQILSPDAGGLRIASPESGGVIVLSPNILSPRINSSQSYIVEVLSPNILGGELHSDENEDLEFGGLARIIGPFGTHENEKHDHSSHTNHNYQSHGSHDSPAEDDQSSHTIHALEPHNQK